jgi:hypothetical protein
MPKFLEDKLKAEYPNNPHAVYGTMNKLGAMHGNKETPKGAKMQAEHVSKMRHTGYVEMTHHGNPGRKPSMRHGS